jgi:predicted phosphodiesterase
MKVGLLSDIHANIEKDNSDSSSLIIGSERNKTTHPFEALEHLMKEESLQLEMLLCAGDLGTGSIPETIEYTWKELHHLKSHFNISNLIATPGNHDHDSRSKFNQYDPKGYLQTLKPRFPCDFGDENSHFWAWNFDIFSTENANILVLNSSAHHGVQNEYIHGRVSETTINKAEEKLKTIEPKPINILLCHHHLYKQEEIDIEDYDAMHGAEKLMQKLISEKHDNWMVIHGHKHFPKIGYSSSVDGDSIPILSAGSFAGDIKGRLGSRVSNQFYVLEFDLDKFEDHGLVGVVTAWDWAFGRGWVKATSNSGLPHKSGFGCKFSKPKFLKALKNLTEETYARDAIIEAIPDLKYMNQSGLEKLKVISEKENLYEIYLEDGAVKSFSKIGGGS